jgi:polysaccharide biosynthesis protein PslH
MRILFLSEWFPFPANNGSKLRIYHLLRGLATQHDISIISFYNPHEGTPDFYTLSSICRSVEVVPWRDYQPRRLGAVLGLFSNTPRSLVDTHSPEMAYKIIDRLQSEKFDLIIASQLTMAAYQPYFRQTPAIFEEAEVGVIYQRYSSAKTPLKKMRHFLTWNKQKAYMQALLRHFFACTVVSTQEKDLLKLISSEYSSIEVIPNGVDLAESRIGRVELKPSSLIYTGSFQYDANYEAMEWFVTKVFQKVRQAIKDVKLTITGNPAGKSFADYEGVEQVGYVPEIRPMMASSWISLAPLQQGGGTRLKILEAMALRTPVVATSKGAEGLDVCHNENILIADEPDTFADQVIKLLLDMELRNRLVENAYSLVRDRYNWDTILPKFYSVIESAGNPLEKKP